MSRIGLKPIEVPSGVKVNIDRRSVTVEGPKGTLKHTFPVGIDFQMEGNQIKVSRASDSKQQRAFHGMARALVANMVRGVKTPWEKVLEIHGTGFNASVQGQELELEIGFTDKPRVRIPEGLEVKAQKGRPAIVKISGSDKQAVGQLAAVIRSKRPPSPYGSDNKGIRYQGEVIRKKAGKAFGDKK